MTRPHDKKLIMKQAILLIEFFKAHAENRPPRQLVYISLTLCVTSCVFRDIYVHSLQLKLVQDMYHF